MIYGPDGRRGARAWLEESRRIVTPREFRQYGYKTYPQHDQPRKEQAVAPVPLAPPAGAVCLYLPSGAATTAWANAGSAGAAGDLAALGTAAALTTLDGKTVVDWSGASAGFGCNSTAFTIGASHTLYIVCQTPADFSATRRIVSGGIGAAGAGSSIVQVSTTPRWQISTIDMSPSGPSANTWYAICAQWNASGTDELLYVNDFTTPTQAATAAGSSTCTGITFGSHSTGVTDWLGKGAFLAGYAGTDDATARAAMRAYLLQEFPSLTIA